MTGDPDLSWERDGTSFYRIAQYIYEELHRARSSDVKRTREQRARVGQLAATHDVLHDLWRELRIKGELSHPTMFTRDEETP